MQEEPQRPIWQVAYRNPRDRHGSFEPQIVTKHQTRWVGFDEKTLSLHARGMTVREIQIHLEEMYGAEVSPFQLWHEVMLRPDFERAKLPPLNLKLGY